MRFGKLPEFPLKRALPYNNADYVLHVYGADLLGVVILERVGWFRTRVAAIAYWRDGKLDRPFVIDPKLVTDGYLPGLLSREVESMIDVALEMAVDAVRTARDAATGAEGARDRVLALRDLTGGIPEATVAAKDRPS